MPPTHYELLGQDPGSLDPDGLRRAFHERSLRCHPDKVAAADAEAAAAAFTVLEHAYRTLSDPARRQVRRADASLAPAAAALFVPRVRCPGPIPCAVLAPLPAAALRSAAGRRALRPARPGHDGGRQGRPGRAGPPVGAHHWPGHAARARADRAADGRHAAARCGAARADGRRSVAAGPRCRPGQFARPRHHAPARAGSQPC
eukprot:SAG22_NODE_1240_length_5042_cov_103.645964_4_plen_202_part_00